MSAPIRIAASMYSRLRGLIGRNEQWLGPEGLLVLVPCSNVHTFLMKKNLDVAFVDSGGFVIETYRDVEPGKMLSATGAIATLERFSSPQSAWFRKGEYISLE